jgi:hypothetical protein
MGCAKAFRENRGMAINANIKSFIGYQITWLAELKEGERHNANNPRLFVVQQNLKCNPKKDF